MAYPKAIQDIKDLEKRLVEIETKNAKLEERVAALEKELAVIKISKTIDVNPSVY